MKVFLEEGIKVLTAVWLTRDLLPTIRIGFCFLSSEFFGFHLLFLFYFLEVKGENTNLSTFLQF